MKSSVLDRVVAEAVHVRALDALEGGGADLLAQRVEHERAAVVALEANSVSALGRQRDRAVLGAPLVAVRVDGLHQVVERRVAGGVGIVLRVALEEALLLGVEELVPAGVALVEPQVAPRSTARRCRRTTCATARAAASGPTCPACSRRTSWCRSARASASPARSRGRPRRRASRRGRTGSARRAPASSPSAPGVTSSSGWISAVIGSAVTSRRKTPEWTPTVGDVVVADGELDQLGRHRLALDVDEVRAAAVGPAARADAVGDRGRAGRHVEADVEASPCRAGGRWTGRK